MKNTKEPPVRNYTKAYGLYKKSVNQSDKFNPYEKRPLSDFNEFIQAMKTHINYKKNYFSNIHTSGYDKLNGKKICRTPYNAHENYVVFYINFFLNDVPMTIVYVADKKPESSFFYNITPIAYSKNAVDENGNPFTIDFLINNAGLKQFKKITNQTNDMYQIDSMANRTPGFDSRTEVFEIPGECFKNLFTKPNIAPLINDYKKTVEEMKGEPITSQYIPWLGEYYREDKAQWDKHLAETSNKRPVDESNIGNDMKRTKISGGKNKKKTKRRKNKKQKTRKRN